MHAVIWTIFAIAGAGQDTASAQARAYAPAAHSASSGQCEDSAGAAGGGTGTRHCWLADWLGPMPQTCYDPHFGCYPGNQRTIHRYPAFHGYYYRDPYNYRHVFEYPWHAAPHEPVGYFTFNSDRLEEGYAPQGSVSSADRAKASQARRPSSSPTLKPTSRWGGRRGTWASPACPR